MVNNKLCTDVGPHTNVNICTLKNVTWRTYLITFTVQCCFLFRFVSIELVSLISVLQIWVAIYVCGTIIFNKEINANVYRHSLWEYSKRFHCSFEWHLTPHMTLSIKTCIRRGHYSIPRGCPLNTGLTVVSLFSWSSSKTRETRKCPLFLRFAHACTPVTKSEEKEKLLEVCRSLYRLLNKNSKQR